MRAEPRVGQADPDCLGDDGLDSPMSGKPDRHPRAPLLPAADCPADGLTADILTAARSACRGEQRLRATRIRIARRPRRCRSRLHARSCRRTPRPCRPSSSSGFCSASRPGNRHPVGHDRPASARWRGHCSSRYAAESGVRGFQDRVHGGGPLARQIEQRQRIQQPRRVARRSWPRLCTHPPRRTRRSRGAGYGWGRPLIGG